MTDLHLPLQRRFTKRAAERRIVEERIVPESIQAPRLLNQLSFHLAAKRTHQLPRFRQRDYTYEPGVSLRNTLHTLKPQTIVGLIGSARSRISRRVNTRLPAQSIHLQSGIIYKQKPGAMFGIVKRLLNRVLFEGRAGLFAWRN